MKRLTFFQLLPGKLKKWRKLPQPTHRYILSNRSTFSTDNHKAQVVADRPQPRWRKVLLKNIHRFQPNRTSAILLVAVLSLTGAMGHRFYNQPQLQEGTVAPQTITVPYSARFEDTKATATKRKEVAQQISTPVLMLDAEVNQQIEQQLQQILTQGNELRQTAGSFPFIQTSILSTSTQNYLRGCPEAEWQIVFNTAMQTSKAKKTILPVATLVNPDLAQAISQLQAYRLQTTPEKFSAVTTAVSQARHRYIQALAKLAELDSATIYESSLLKLSDAEWQKTIAGISASAERILAQGISPGLPPSILQQAVNLQVQTHVSEITEALATEILLKVLKPNLAEDVVQTQLQVAQAADAVQPVMLEVQKDEVIVRAGEKIDRTEFVLLDHFRLSRREINWLGLLQQAGYVIGAIGIYRLVEWRFLPKLRTSDRLLILLLSLSPPLLATFSVPYTSLPAVGLLLGSFYGPVLSVTVVGLLTALLPVSLGVGWLPLVTGAAGGLLGSLMAGRMRSREELALLGGGVGITQGTVYLLLNLIISAATGSIGSIGFQAAGLFAVSGFAWSVVALGLSPYLEHLFDLVTPIRLAELANPNRPLLKRLATEAPGTFQHTLLVATLAEAAAKALRCNVELVRAGTLYHDIGKLHDPLAFIENQMSCGNKHDEINDPWKSAEIIKKHVTEGLVMARRHRLPVAIRNFIPEHQGKMLIAYFYHQAQQLAAQDPSVQVQESDFRYDGPIPQSRETGIVNLADSCEAAMRSLKDATPEVALATVNKILRARWQDNQLVDSGLKREELSRIAEIFVAVWQQFHHKRIAYPKSVVIK